MGMFSEEVAKAEANARLPFLKTGKYLVKIDALREHKGFKGESFSSTFTVIESDNPERQPGMKCVMIQKMDKPEVRIMGAKAIKSLIAAIVGLEDPQELKLEEIEAALSSSNPLNGRQVEVQVHLNQNDFPVHNWIPLPEDQQPEEVRFKE